MANECVVYHKHLAGMDLTDGYIGISKNFEERMKQHHRDAFVKHSIYTVHEKMRMYGDEVITTKIFEGSIEECFKYEEELRPRWRIGWNMAIGGGRVGSGWKPGKNWIENRIWNLEHGEVMIHKDMTIQDFARKYMEDISRSGVSSGISQVLQGRVVRYRKWELADAQLSMRIEERIKRKWESVYVIKGHEVLKIDKKAQNKFYEYTNIRKGKGHLNMLVTGQKHHLDHWELATEEEWLETAERVEFK